MKLINYQTNSLLKRLIYNKGKLISASYFEKESYEKGMVFFGRVESFHAPLKGYFINLGSGSALYQTSEKLIIGKHYLFEIFKTFKDKKPLLTRNVGFVGRYLIYRPHGNTKVSDKINSVIRDKLLALNLEGVYFKLDSQVADKIDILEEYEYLSNLYRELSNAAFTQKRARLVYAPPTNYSSSNVEEILRHEEEILGLHQKTIFKDRVTYFVEPTRVGLIIDVNRSSSLKSDSEINESAIEFILDLIMKMNVGGVILIDLIGNRERVDVRKIKESDDRITSATITDNGIIELVRRSVGKNLYDMTDVELMADYIDLKREYWNGPTPKGVIVSKRYVGIEKYLDIDVTYSDVYDLVSFEI